MLINEQSSHARYGRSFTVEGGPVLPHPGSSTGKKFRVTHVSIEYTLKNGEWIINSSFAVTLLGPVLKKDGTEGKETYSGAVYDWRGDQPEYQWLRSLVAVGRPLTAPTISEVKGLTLA